MKNEDLKILTPTERGVWGLIGEMEPDRVAMAVEMLLVDAIRDRKAAAAATLEERRHALGAVAS